MEWYGIQEEISARRKQVSSANDKFGKIYKKINEDSDEKGVDSEVICTEECIVVSRHTCSCCRSWIPCVKCCPSLRAA